MDKQTQEYFAALPADRKDMCLRLHELIAELYADVVIDMSYRMPTYKVKDGWVAWANRKHYVSLYTCGEIHITEFKKKYPSIKTGRGCINFKSTDSLPESAIKKVIRHAIEKPKG